MQQQSMVFRLDENVIITLLATAVAASIIFALRFSRYEPCGAFGINVPGAETNTGTAIRVETDVKKFSSLQWDFGDNQTDISTVNSAVHSYDTPGEYVITLTVDGKCTQYKTILVKEAPKTADPSFIARVTIPENTEVGKPTAFSDASPYARSWEWRFGETADVDAISKNPVYVYRSPGWKTISLVINGNVKNALIRKIYVNPPRSNIKADKDGGKSPVIIVPAKPLTDPLQDQLAADKAAAPSTPEPRTPEISVAEFKQMLTAVAGGSMQPSAFSKYFCDGNLNTFTNLNGDPATFSQLCSRLANLKKASQIRSMTVTLKKDHETNCITAVDVIVKIKSGIFNLNTTKLR